MKRRRGALAIVLFAWVAVSASAALASGDNAASGRSIFRRGLAADEVSANFSGSIVALPPRVRRCAGCHGANGEGGREGGVDIPSIAWPVLAAPRADSPARPGRPAYDEAAVKRVLADAVDPAGRKLAASMPRFRLTPAQFAGLFGYLQAVGTERDLDPGIAGDEIRVGAVLPLSGPRAAWGEAMRAGLAATLAAAGSIYGRRLQLMAVDAGADTAAAVRSLASGDRIFAMVGTLLPPDVAGDEALQDMPIIGTLASIATQHAPNQFDLQASVDDQMRVLVDQLADEAPRPLRLAVVGADGRLADAVVDQAKRNDATVVRYESVEGLIAADPKPNAVLALPDADVRSLATRAVTERRGWLLGASASAIDPGAASEQLRLVLPILSRVHNAGDPSGAATPPMAAATVAILVEALKRTGSRVSRAGLIAAIEGLHDFTTGVLPPLNFSKTQRVGSRASIVVRFDRARGRVALGSWRAPR